MAYKIVTFAVIIAFLIMGLLTLRESEQPYNKRGNIFNYQFDSFVAMIACTSVFSFLG